MYRLHGLAQSGNTFKVAFALRVLQQPCELVFVDFMNAATRSPQWRAELNPMGEIPVLDDGPRRLTQSGAILTLLARRHGALGGRDDDEQFEVLRWLLFDNHKFTSYFATWRYMKSFAPTPPDPAVRAFLMPRIENCFGIVEQHLAGREFLVGDALTIADLSLSGYLFFPTEESGIDLPGRYPAIARWVQRLREVPGWQDPYEMLPGERIAPKW